MATNVRINNTASSLIVIHAGAVIADGMGAGMTIAAEPTEKAVD